MLKHAYLIMAHGNEDILKKLLNFLDDERNDIYIHIDKKWTNFNSDIFEICKYSQIFPIARTSVTWGGYSQINLEYRLIKAALNREEKYEYLHLLSGEDLPIKSQDEIHEFFHNNVGKEFLGYDEEWAENKAIKKRYALYWLMQEKSGKDKRKICWYLEHILAKIEYILKVDRTKKYEDIKFSSGPNWFSITGEFAKYVLEQEDMVKRIFKNTVCCDEIFMQTILRNSKYKNNLYIPQVDSGLGKVYDQCLRCIEFGQGECSPKYWEYGRVKELLEYKNMCFARKFKYETEEDKKMIERLEQEIMNNNLGNIIKRC